MSYKITLFDHRNINQNKKLKKRTENINPEYFFGQFLFKSRTFAVVFNSYQNENPFSTQTI